MKRDAIGCWLGALLLLASAPASAQYACRVGNTIYQSPRPCPSETATEASRPRLQQLGPVPQYEPRGYSPPSARLPPADAHLKYLSAQCVEISEAIRTGPARGIRAETMGDLRRDYQAKCSEEDQAARRELAQQQRREGDALRAKAQAERAERERAAEQAKQCDESLRTLGNRRQRLATMTEGEKADLARFEAVHRARCQRG